MEACSLKNEFNANITSLFLSFSMKTNATLQKSIWIFFSFLLLKRSDSQVRILQGPFFFFFLLWFIAANYDLYLDFSSAPINGANAVQSNLFSIHTVMAISW